MTIPKLSPEQVAKAIETPVQEWPGSCWYICVYMLEAGLLPKDATLKYGRWTGPMVYGKYRAMMKARYVDDPSYSRRHAWIEMADGTVVDPTRYVFEGMEPYIYVGENDTYDGSEEAERQESRSLKELQEEWAKQ